jgi:hypothetical protein
MAANGWLIGREAAYSGHQHGQLPGHCCMHRLHGRYLPHRRPEALIDKKSFAIN